MGLLARRLRDRWGLLGLGVLVVSMMVGLSRPIGAAVEDRVEVLRDPWGVPHVFAETDEGAMFGLGSAVAADRAFQMHLTRRIMQGRLAETIGNQALDGRRESTLDLDRKNRTFDWARAADRVVAGLDEETRGLLEAYCAGVNAAWSERGDRLDPLFARYETEPEAWTPADCLLAWWHLGQFFATDGTRDLIAWRNRDRDRGRFDPAAIEPDDSAAVIQADAIDPAWLGRVRAYLREQGFELPDEGEPEPTPGGPEGPSFSHAWAVGGERSTTGSTVLVSMPQTVVANPPLFYEWHVVGETFNARGIGVPGSPALLIGFTDRVAWGLTALGADQADLFRLQTSPDRPDSYAVDGEWREMEVREETILVKGGEPVTLTVRETHLGPVVTEFAFANEGDGEVALRRVPLCDAETETIAAAVAMIRADDAEGFDEALRDWRFPSANIVFGDKGGTLGYRTIGAFPMRSPETEGGGSWAFDGSTARSEWLGFVPHELAPHLIDPASGVLFSANHRPIDSVYPIPLGIATGSLGDTVRSWRLRELLTPDEAAPFSPEAVRAMADDPVNPARRSLVRLGLHLRDREGADLAPEAIQALDLLGPWLDRGANSQREDPGTPVALELSTFFRIMATPLAGEYGGGESGLSRWLREAIGRIEGDPAARLREEERAFVENALVTAWEAATARYGEDPATWTEGLRIALTERVIPSHRGLDPLPPIATDRDETVPPLPCPDGGTIRSDVQRAYVQFVRLDDPDASQSLLPLGGVEGNSDATRALWAEGELHPAPLSREAVERIAVDRAVLIRAVEEAGR
ncbi:penicillin acylase family protein [Tautonia sp. JC769]|uniref:penicillin acylase family protein n=1 Tax=Tautonia sp. JC769 TaxID=3232135 RepID=UPI003457C15D